MAIKKTKNKNLGIVDNFNILQYELNQLLKSFLNAGFSKKGFILYPLSKDISKENKMKLKGILNKIRDLEKRGMEFKESGKIKVNLINLNQRKFVVIISKLYSDLEKNMRVGKTTKKTVSTNKIDVKKYQNSYLKPVIDLKKFSEKNLKEYVSGIYVHGSLATLDYVEGWSDLDTLVIIKKEAMLDPNKLLRLRNLMYKSKIFFYKIDPLQHHGHLLFTEFDMNYYCQTFFPLVLFKYSKSLIGNKKLNFGVRDSSKENKSRFLYFTDYFINLNKNMTLFMSSYNLKLLLHLVTLFPTMYLQSKNSQVYKKFSFDIARKEFTKKEWSVIDYVSSLRDSWKQPKKSFTSKYEKINPLLAYQANSKYWDLFSNISKLNNVDLIKIIEGMAIISKSALKKSKH